MMVNIRQSWQDYYQSLGFIVTPSAPLVHPSFPTSFNMSAGLVQLDSRIRSISSIQPVKECLIQKCVRYYDIEKVGDGNHLSFFEMAGAFEIVEFEESRTVINVWNFFTKILNIDPNKLWITIFDEDKVVDKTISTSQTLKDSLTSLVNNHLVFAKSDTNLWKQGGGVKLSDNIRLCGPQVEFFYDLGKNNCQHINCNPLCGCGRFLEISNILLIKYYIDCNQMPTLKKLINPATEVVIGIERCGMVVENQSDVFNTSYCNELTKLLGINNISEDVKIIVDHIKSLSFILSEEKITPSRSARGRIIRTLIRNMLTSFYMLGLDHRVLIPRLVDTVITQYEKVYPEITNCKNNVLDIVFDHEKTYNKTLNKAKKHIQLVIKTDDHQLTKEEIDYYWEKFGVQKKLIFTLLNRVIPFSV